MTLGWKTAPAKVVGVRCRFCSYLRKDGVLPASAKDVALGTYRGTFGTAETVHGRHERHGNIRRATEAERGRHVVTQRAA